MKEEIKHGFVQDNANWIAIGVMVGTGIYLFMEWWPKDGVGYNKLFPIVALGIGIFVIWKFMVNKIEVMPLEEERLAPKGGFDYEMPPRYVPGPGGHPLPKDEWERMRP